MDIAGQPTINYFYKVPEYFEYFFKSPNRPNQYKFKLFQRIFFFKTFNVNCVLRCVLDKITNDVVNILFSNCTADGSNLIVNKLERDSKLVSTI